MRLLGFAAGTMAALVLSAAVFAEDINITAEYNNISWQGDNVAYDEMSQSIYFAQSEMIEYQAVYEADVSEGATGFLFRVDGGNGVNVKDSGICMVEFADDSGEVLFSVSTGEISGRENYSRFSIGTEEEYYPVPEGATKVRITLKAQQKDGFQKIGVYFRNMALFFSGEKMLSLPDSDGLMKETAGLTRVEAGINPATRWIWVGIVFFVALAFYFIKMWRDKYKSAELLKAGKKK